VLSLRQNLFPVLLVFLQATLLKNVQALTITGVSHSPGYLSHKQPSNVKIHYRLDKPASVVVKLFDDHETLVRKINIHSAKKGDNFMLWDGADHYGKQLPAEAYRYTLEATAGNEVVVYDTSDITGNEAVEVRSVKWNKKKQQVSYVINKASRVSLRVGIDNAGPLLSTITDWLPRARGEHVEKWNGMDISQKINISKIQNTIIHARAYSMSSNAIILGPYSNKSNYADIRYQDAEKREVSKKRWKQFDYMSKNARTRSDYVISLRLPESTKSVNGTPVFTGIVPIRISLQKGELERLQQDRFEPMLYMDGKFVSELETGFFPITWRLDTSKYSEGEHFLTVNLRGYDGQFGVTTGKLYIRHKL